MLRTTPSYFFSRQAAPTIFRRSAAASTTASSRFSSRISSSCSSSFVATAFAFTQYSSFHSLALEQAMRVTAPSPKHPATGAPDADAAKKPTPITPTTLSEVTDPTTVWREHWDVEFQRPYYHNLITNECRTTLPEGFPTRFLFYYNREKGGVKHEPSDSGKAPQYATRAKTMKEKMKDFGLAGFLVYGVVHFGMLGCIFLIMLAGVDVRGLLKSVHIDIGNRLKGDQSIWAVWLVAILVNKVFVPLQLLATVTLAPKVAPVLKRFLIRVGIKA